MSLPSHILIDQSRPASPDEAAVLQAMDALAQACLAPSREGLTAVLHPELTYSHSDAHLQSREDFITALLSGRSGFKGIRLEDVGLQLSGDLALVRQHALYDTFNGGVPGTADLQINQVWQRSDGVWRLRLRQARKTHP